VDNEVLAVDVAPAPKVAPLLLVALLLRQHSAAERVALLRQVDVGDKAPELPLRAE
jgi:hypothetical protein